jgi:hypothetical protein
MHTSADRIESLMKQLKVPLDGLCVRFPPFRLGSERHRPAGREQVPREHVTTTSDNHVSLVKMSSPLQSTPSKKPLPNV